MAGLDGPPFTFGRSVNPGIALKSDCEKKIAAPQKKSLKCCFAAYICCFIEIAFNEVDTMTNESNAQASFADLLNKFPADISAFNAFAKNSAKLNESLSKVALEAAERSTEVYYDWAKATIEKLGDVTKAKDEPSDYARALGEFGSNSLETNAERQAAFAEIARKVQTETVEILLAAGKEAQETVFSAAKSNGSAAPQQPSKPAAASKK